MNLGIILTLPEPLIPAEGVVQESVPEPSVLSTWLADPSVFGMVIAPAVIVPLVSILVTFVSPNLILFEASTIALWPIAVALFKLVALPEPMPALFPIKVLLYPLTLYQPAI